MKVLFVVYHPVDPYIVFETAKKIQDEGGEVLFVIIEKEDIIKTIIDSYGYENIVIGKNKKSNINKALQFFTITFKLKSIIKKFSPSVVFSTMSPDLSAALMLSKIPLICWSDTEIATFNYKYSHRRIDSILQTESYYKDTPFKNIIEFNGYKELAYLHPNIFKPDESILNELGLTVKDRIVLMRFSALTSIHDIGLESEILSNESKLFNFVEKIEKLYDVKVLISMTERELGKRFDKYKLNIHPSKYIHLLSFCTLYFGEGTTTASESGVLGVPWINIQQTKRGYLIDQEKNYGLGFRTNNMDEAFKKGDEYLKKYNIKTEWALKKEKLIQDKIDVSAFFTWFIMNYPESQRIMKKDPSYQNKFK